MELAEGLESESEEELELELELKLDGSVRVLLTGVGLAFPLERSLFLRARVSIPVLVGVAFDISSQYISASVLISLENKGQGKV